jgi:hypothetical protein
LNTDGGDEGVWCPTYALGAFTNLRELHIDHLLHSVEAEIGTLPVLEKFSSHLCSPGIPGCVAVIAAAPLLKTVDLDIKELGFVEGPTVRANALALARSIRTLRQLLALTVTFRLDDEDTHCDADSFLWSLVAIDQSVQPSVETLTITATAKTACLLSCVMLSFPSLTSVEVRGHGDTGTRGHGDTGTRGHGDTGTRGRDRG